MLRIRHLEDELTALAIQFGKHPTYGNAVLIQICERERNGLIAGLRGKIRLAVDNSEFWE